MGNQHDSDAATAQIQRKMYGSSQNEFAALRFSENRLQVVTIDFCDACHKKVEIYSEASKIKNVINIT